MMKLINLFQQGGNTDNLQQVRGVFGCLFHNI